MGEVVKKILQGGRALYLAYDQGLEHGPVDFNDVNVDPAYILDIAKKGKYTAMIFQKGIVEQYGNLVKKSKIPLIIKLNGKTSLTKGEPISQQICSVKEAVKLGAVAVGYTIYFGSTYERIMMYEFARIEEEAHSLGLPVILWAYPRGKAVEGKSKDDLMEYSARIGLEIGADMVKLQYSGNPLALQKTIRAAGRTKVVIAGGAKIEEKEFLDDVKRIMDVGVAGIAVGRNVWQNDNPEKISKQLREIVLP